MPNFDKYSNYTSDCAFTSVVFGADAPVLEVELNEMQQIFHEKLGLLLKGWGNMLFPLSDNSLQIVGNGDAIVIQDCVALCEGFIFYIEKCTVVYPKTTTDPKHLWVGLKERDVTGDSTLRRYGHAVSDKTVVNKIKDSRNPVETSRRKSIWYQTLFTEGSVATVPDTSGYDKFVRVATFTVDPTTQKITSTDWNVGRPVTTKDLAGLTGLADATVE